MIYGGSPTYEDQNAKTLTAPEPQNLAQVSPATKTKVQA